MIAVQDRRTKDGELTLIIVDDQQEYLELETRYPKKLGLRMEAVLELSDDDMDYERLGNASEAELDFAIRAELEEAGLGWTISQFEKYGDWWQQTVFFARIWVLEGYWKDVLETVDHWGAVLEDQIQADNLGADDDIYDYFSSWIDIVVELNRILRAPIPEDNYSEHLMLISWTLMSGYDLDCWPSIGEMFVKDAQLPLLETAYPKENKDV